MFKLPRSSKFTYDDKPRIVIEKGPVKGGLCCWQLSPERGYRTFKPAKMFDIQKCGFWASLWYLIRSIRVEIGA